jgi:uncharacterized membrane protein YhaH (DUF805 family)
VATLALLVVYHALRIAASQCGGSACDWYILLSLLLPLAVLVLAAVTGAIAISAARRTEGERAGRLWLGLIVTCTLLGVFGPLVALAVLRDSPDTLVPLATVLLVLTPVSVLAYSMRRRGRQAAGTR